jgi:hypothetical protein
VFALAAVCVLRQLRERVARLRDAVTADPLLGAAAADGGNILALENGRPGSARGGVLLPPMDARGPATDA